MYFQKSQNYFTFLGRFSALTVLLLFFNFFHGGIIFCNNVIIIGRYFRSCLFTFVYCRSTATKFNQLFVYNSIIVIISRRYLWSGSLIGSILFGLLLLQFSAVEITQWIVPNFFNYLNQWTCRFDTVLKPSIGEGCCSSIDIISRSTTGKEGKIISKSG